MKLPRRLHILDYRKPQVAVMGVMRSGTNLVSWILENHWNLTVNDAAFGWKHGGVPVLSPKSSLKYKALPLVYVVKNPFAFAVSLHRYANLPETKVSVKGEQDFDAFLRSPVVIFDTKLSGSPQWRYSNPIQYWNAFYWNMETLDRTKFPVVGVNYEDVLINPCCLDALSSISSARRCFDDIKLPVQALKRNSADGHHDVSDQTFQAQYYAERRYLDAFTPAQIDFVAAQADPWLMQARGYDAAPRLRTH